MLSSVLFLQCVLSFSEDYEFIDAEFSEHVDEHRSEQDEVCVPVCGFKRIAPPCRKRCEDAVVDEYLEHCNRHVCSALEGEVAVQGEVPDDRAHQCYEVAWPVALAECLDGIMQKGEHSGLYQSGRCAEQDELNRLHYDFLP